MDIYPKIAKRKVVFGIVGFFLLLFFCFFFYKGAFNYSFFFFFFKHICLLAQNKINPTATLMSPKGCQNIINNPSHSSFIFEAMSSVFSYKELQICVIFSWYQGSKSIGKHVQTHNAHAILFQRNIL